MSMKSLLCFLLIVQIGQQLDGTYRIRHHKHAQANDVTTDTSVHLSEKFDTIESNAVDVKSGEYDVVVNDNSNSFQESGLFPPIFDVAPLSIIYANATCGTASFSKDETFCKLRGSNTCAVCSDFLPDKRHPISFAIDNEANTWWQSPALEQGPQFEYVTITMNLEQEYYIWNIIIKCAISPRPANAILERSIDGTHYSVWQYFANEEDCWQRYNHVPSNTTITQSDNGTLCLTVHSKLKPLEDGQIHANIAKGRRGCVSNCKAINTAELKDFSRARFVRFRFQKYNVPAKDKYSSLSDPSLRRSLFYSIKKITVMAQCICHGHASKCKQSSTTNLPTCDCKHNTAGNYCEKCAPLFNQRPWQEGTLSESNACEQCQCHGHSTACHYDAFVDAKHASLNIRGEYRGGGVCISCSKNTTGTNCEKCKPNWYRPSGVSPDAEEPCLRCECHHIGSNGSCVGDDTEYELSGKRAGMCECLKGFAGRNCDQCDVGFFNFPDCLECKCDPRGTEVQESCERRCVCKENVEGEMCDQCKPGYFDLSSTSILGCKMCYCSDVADKCSEATGLKLTNISNITEWTITNAAITSIMEPIWDNETNSFIIYDSEVNVRGSNYFWLAPSSYLGNRLTSYGLSLRVSISWNVLRGDTSGKPVFNPDVIIVGSNDLRIAYGNRSYEEAERTNLSVPLSEDGWYRVEEDAFSSDSTQLSSNHSMKMATRKDILSILTDLKYLLIRAKFYTGQADCSLLEVKLETGIEEEDERMETISGIERCYCAAGYAGLSCEKCDYGYARVRSNSDSRLFICTLCDCNGHSASCDSVMGRCHTCEHNTTGLKCGQCKKGFYGNAETGTPEDCTQCACPLSEPSNNFSPTCILKNASTKQYKCDKCPTGYTGDHCERCAEGHFGNPVQLGSTCVPCNCNGKPCNTTSGQCLDCSGLTEGWYCERCKVGYYGNAIEKNCSTCDCNSLGSENLNICNVFTGQCSCKMNYVGRTCNTCLDGSGDISSGCPPCACNALGSVHEICEPITGQCICKPGVTGKMCDRCLDNYFGFENGIGCEACNCNKSGCESDDCDSVTGQCFCKNNVVGRSCNQCTAGYWGLSENGCEPCECNDIGSLSPLCDSTIGQCHCKYGIVGLKCDRCKANFYGFSKFGCFECEPCDKPGHVCDVDSGRCLCPMLTEGLHCEHCTFGAWNYSLESGCQDCYCDRRGSKSNRCNFITGQCECHNSFSGEKCSSCASGYFGFPKCRPCSCNTAGSDPEKCWGDRCLCDLDGQCYCKPNTEGKKCDRCKEGTFGLNADNVDGCTACFCFGRSTQCTEAGLTWSHIRLLSDRVLLVHYNVTNNSLSNSNSLAIYPVNPQQVCFINYLQPDYSGNSLNANNAVASSIKLNVTNNLRLIPGVSGDVEIGVDDSFSTPIYWQLPDSFLGDKILSYGGYLEFNLETEGEKISLPLNVLESYPLVQIQGNDKFVLEYFPPLPVPEKKHRVRLHESLWKSKNNPTGSVTREVFMLALQNLQEILIRATESVDFIKAVLKDVLMDVAMPREDLTPQIASITHGIEMCECPYQYTSSSCQNPNIGYYRYYDNKTTAVSTIIIQIVGEATPCTCNGMSTVCDTNSGSCLNCSNNTGGRHCERCADGYYKDNLTGHCKPCPCPYVANNHAIACSFPSSPKNFQEQLTCHCQLGYSGKFCDKCSYEFYGFPRLENGKCEPCNCNYWGMTSNECHEETGQCNCRSETTGRDCSRCLRKNHVLTPKGCAHCSDTCVKILLNEIEATSKYFEVATAVLLPKILEPPWTSLRNVNKSCENVERLFNSSLMAMQRVVHYGHSKEEELRKKVKNSKAKMKSTWKYIQQNLTSALSVILSQVSTLSNLSKVINNEINAIHNNLEKYILTEKTNLNLLNVLNEARYLQNKINELEDYGNMDKVDRILNYCRVTLEDVRTYYKKVPELEELKKHVQSFKAKVEDIQQTTTNAKTIIDQVAEYAEICNHLLIWVKNVSRDIENIVSDINSRISQSKAVLSGVQKFMSTTTTDLQIIVQKLHRLRNVINEVEKKGGILFNLNESYRQKFVIPAVSHAAELTNRARFYDSLFVPTRQDADLALQASIAYKNIVDAVAETEKILTDANNLIKNELVSERNEDKIAEKAYSTEEISRNLLTIAKLGKADVESLKKQYDYQQNTIDILQTKLQEMIQNISFISSQLEGMGRATDDKIKSMNETLKRYKGTIDLPDEVYDNIFSVQDKINDELKPKISHMQGLGEIGLQPGDELKIKETEEVTHKMLSQLRSTQLLFQESNKYIEKWNSSVADQLRALKNKIQQTKHLANGIHLSLSSKSDHELCSRSYQSKYIKPDIINYISLTYAVQSHHRDVLLFYLASSITDDFLAVEMINRKIRFIWDLGGGPAEVTHPLHIQTAGDLEKDQHWYKIEVERISNMGKLSVRPVTPSGSSVLASGSPVTNASTVGWSKFDVSGNDSLWIGGPIDKPVNSFILSKRSGLVGCLSRVLFDNRPIGLWNFKSETSGNCVACIEGTKEVREDGSYFFTGDGYAAVQGHGTSVYNKYFFSVSANFKTFDENSILFYAAATNPNQYILVMMEEGRVVLQIKYTQDIMLEIKSSNRYMTGNWTHLEAARFYDRKKKVEKGILKVGGEVKEGFPMPPLMNPSEIPDLSLPQYFFGGLPPDFESDLVALPQSFLGCMSDLQVMQEAYDPFKGPYWGIEKSCSDKPLAVVSFKGNGYLELASHPLKKTASFGFIFSTNQKEAFLMLSTTEGLGSSEIDDMLDDGGENEDSKVNFYSVSIKDGRVEIVVNSGYGSTRLTSRADSFYSDGQAHSINVIKTGKRLELRINDLIQAIGFMEEDGPGDVKAAGKIGGLFFGGVPADFESNSSISNVPLMGTIQNAIFTERLLHFDQPIEFERANIGRSDMFLYTDSDTFTSMQNTQEASSCRRTHSYFVEPFAVQFGDLSRSYVRLDYDRQVFHNKNSTVQLMFRTFYSDGLLLLIPGADDKQSQWVRLFLHSGKIYAFVKGKRRFEISCEMSYNDGDWHRMILVRDGKTLIMNVDNAITKTISIPKKLNLLNAVYVGGYLSEIPVFESSLWKVESLKGCIKEVVINGRKEDLVGGKAKHHHVSQCFPRIERGAHFSGDAYSIFADKFDIGTSLQLELEFRTSEMNGILVSVSEPQGYPAISLELVRGKVVVNGDMGDRRPFRIEQEFSSTYYLCDNQWHRVKVSLIEEGIALSVDDKNKMYWLSDNGHITEAHTTSPLYIGGIADNAMGGSIENRQNFKGCVRNVTIGEIKVDWVDFNKLHNVLISSCPVQ